LSGTVDRCRVAAIEFDRGKTNDCPVGRDRAGVVVRNIPRVGGPQMQAIIALVPEVDASGRPCRKRRGPASIRLPQAKTETTVIRLRQIPVASAAIVRFMVLLLYGCRSGKSVDRVSDVPAGQVSRHVSCACTIADSREFQEFGQKQRSCIPGHQLHVTGATSTAITQTRRRLTSGRGGRMLIVQFITNRSRVISRGRSQRSF
jgi:hypothetical protein